MPDAAPLLELRNIETFYGPIMAIRGVSLRVFEGEIVTVLGANGAGKSTLLKTACGALNCRKGQVLFAGTEIQNSDPDAVARRGIAHVPEGREVFPLLSVEENLRMGAFNRHLLTLGGKVDKLVPQIGRENRRIVAVTMGCAVRMAGERFEKDRAARPGEPCDKDRLFYLDIFNRITGKFRFEIAKSDPLHRVAGNQAA